MFSARVVADSVSEEGHRLTSIVASYPRFIHSEVMTHRVFSRNAASSRAIPVRKMLDRIRTDPAAPVSWGKNQSGMQAEEELPVEVASEALRVWLAASADALKHAEAMVGLGVHKQIANRLLEPFAWMETLITATEWENFLTLRTHKDAQPEFQHVAKLMRDAMEASTPAEVRTGEGIGWHVPFFGIGDDPEIDADTRIPIADWPLVSVGRCARISYLTHDGKHDPTADVALAKRLQASGHMSPFEHVARPMRAEERRASAVHGAWPAWVKERHHMCGNFRGWIQYRKTLPGEAVWCPEP